uniref:Uncharacterized protein n=1 Tax=Arundo donax TaxID=35708 RepID=A0A0A9AK04_ARUDO
MSLNAVLDYPLQVKEKGTNGTTFLLDREKSSLRLQSSQLSFLRTHDH